MNEKQNQAVRVLDSRGNLSMLFTVPEGNTCFLSYSHTERRLQRMPITLHDRYSEGVFLPFAVLVQIID